MSPFASLADVPAPKVDGECVEEDATEPAVLAAEIGAPRPPVASAVAPPSSPPDGTFLAEIGDPASPASSRARLSAEHTLPAGTCSVAAATTKYIAAATTAASANTAAAAPAAAAAADTAAANSDDEDVDGNDGTAPPRPTLSAAPFCVVAAKAT